MKLRFLIGAGPDGALRQLEASMKQDAGSLVLAFSTNNHRLWIERGTPVLTNSSATSVAIGILFDRSTAAPLTALPDCRDLETRLVRDCWGAYALLTTDGHSHSVLRDPSGSVPVYYGVAGELELYASDSALLRRAWPKPFRPNIDAVRHWLTFPFLRTATTGAVGVTELLPGSSLQSASRDRYVEERWSPATFATASCAIAQFEEAAPRLREQILRTVPALAGGHSPVTLRLSGGLDSSIVAAALAHGQVAFRAVTFATRSNDGDERSYARAIAQAFGIELREMSEAQADLPLDTNSDPFRRPPSPLLQPLRRAFAASSDDGGGLVLDGAGGDNVFGALNTASPALDAVRGAGVSEGIRTLHNIAAVHGCTFWSAARSASRRVLRGRTLHWPADRTFLLSSGTIDEPECHPWIASATHLPPGSADHVRMIAGIHHFLPDPQPGDALGLHPLLAQPIVELCLRVPSWLWFTGGRDRAVARAAFRGIVPDRILDRRGKGSLESMFMRGYLESRAKLRDFLVDGCLAQHGIIDADALAAYLALPGQPRDAGYIRILEIASAEQWLRSFSAPAP